MKKRELINKIEALPISDLDEILIFDHRMNFAEDSGESEPNGAGLYSDFEVDTMNTDLSHEEYLNIKEITDEEPVPFGYLSFDNPDYHDPLLPFEPEESQENAILKVIGGQAFNFTDIFNKIENIEAEEDPDCTKVRINFNSNFTETLFVKCLAMEFRQICSRYDLAAILKLTWSSFPPIE